MKNALNKTQNLELSTQNVELSKEEQELMDCLRKRTRIAKVAMPALWIVI